MNNEGFEYDIQKRARAGTAATFRAVVALYILYLGYKLIRGVTDGSSTMLPWQGWAFGLLFFLAGLAVGYYAWRRYRIDLEAARLPKREGEALPGSDGAPPEE